MTKTTTCSIPNCGKLIKTGGLCSMHAERKRRHGDPLLGGKKITLTCSMEDCGKPHYGHGLCIAHYKRNVRHGSPTGGGTGKGFVRKWLAEVAIPFAGEECLTFPFGRDVYGYGRMNHQGGQGAHRYILIATAGSPPAGHEACHTCGKGHLACVNPKHLYWGTRADNVRDSIAHGTFRNHLSRCFSLTGLYDGRNQSCLARVGKAPAQAQEQAKIQPQKSRTATQRRLPNDH